VRRSLTALFAVLAFAVAGLMSAAPAQAGTAPVQPGTSTMTATKEKGGPVGRAALNSCEQRQRFTWTPTFVFGPGDCYQTPGSALVMQFDGDFVLYFANGTFCHTNTSGYFGAIVVFQDDGNLVLYWNGTPIVWSGTVDHPNSSLILRGGDGMLLIRDAAGNQIWQFC
jgi:hypothetical protein